VSSAADVGPPDAAPGPADPPDRPGPDAAPAGRSTGEFVMALLLAALGLYLILDAANIAVPGSANQVGPRFFPYLIGGVIVATGVALAARVWRGDRGPADESEDVDPTAGTSWQAVGIISVAFLAQALLINVIGWPLAVALMFAMVAWALGARGFVRPFLAGIITSAVVWIIFVKGLNVALPGGTLLEWATDWF
jgi:putative tricarboxylic transport membrane protein